MNMHIYNEHVSTDITISNEHSIMLIGFNKKNIIKMEKQRIINIFLKYGNEINNHVHDS